NLHFQTLVSTRTGLIRSAICRHVMAPHNRELALAYWVNRYDQVSVYDHPRLQCGWHQRETPDCPTGLVTPGKQDQHDSTQRLGGAGAPGTGSNNNEGKGRKAKATNAISLAATPACRPHCPWHPIAEAELA